MRGAYRIIDADGHVQDPVDLWERWLDPAFLSDAPVREADGEWRWRGNAAITRCVPP